MSTACVHTKFWGMELRALYQVFYMRPQFQANKSVYWSPNGTSIFLSYLCLCLLLFLNNLYFHCHLYESSVFSVMLSLIQFKYGSFVCCILFHLIASLTHSSLVPSVKPGFLLILILIHLLSV